MTFWNKKAMAIRRAFKRNYEKLNNICKKSSLPAIFSRHFAANAACERSFSCSCQEIVQQRALRREYRRWSSRVRASATPTCLVSPGGPAVDILALKRYQLIRNDLRLIRDTDRLIRISLRLIWDIDRLIRDLCIPHSIFFNIFRARL